jgi:hypothetical protein
MHIIKINGIIIKMDNYELQIEHFSVGSIYEKLSRPINAINHLPPPLYNMQNGVGMPP